MGNRKSHVTDTFLWFSQTPLDEVDAAARVLDPIFVLHQEKNHDESPMFGQFLKDFKISEW